MNNQSNNKNKEVKKVRKPATKKSDTLEVGIDCGFGNVKIYSILNGEEVKFSFPSRFKQIHHESTDVITINNENYTFIEGDLIVDNGHLSKNNSDTRVLLWKALYDLYLKTGISKFNVCMNAALDSYKADNGMAIQSTMVEVKDIKYKERFKNEVSVGINNLACFPECLVGGGTVTKDQLKLREEEVIMIDFGTLNMQGIYVLHGSPDYNKSFATDYGMQHIYRSLANIVKLEERGLATAAAMQLYLEKTAKDEKYIMPKVDDIIINYLIEGIFKELDIELNMIKPSMYCKYLLIGGGSSTLQRFLETKFIEDKEKVFLEDGYYATAKGLYRKALRIFNEKEGVK